MRRTPRRRWSLGIDDPNGSWSLLHSLACIVTSVVRLPGRPRELSVSCQSAATTVKLGWLCADHFDQVIAPATHECPHNEHLRQSAGYSSTSESAPPSRRRHRPPGLAQFGRPDGFLSRKGARVPPAASCTTTRE